MSHFVLNEKQKQKCQASAETFSGWVNNYPPTVPFIRLSELTHAKSNQQEHHHRQQPHA